MPKRRVTAIRAELRMKACPAKNTQAIAAEIDGANRADQGAPPIKMANPIATQNMG